MRSSAGERVGQSVHGDPCRECGFEWLISPDEALALIRAAPYRYADTLQGRDGSQRQPDLDWSAGTYVCHVTDNLRIWAERLAGSALGAVGPVANYDGDLLARARAYERIPIRASLWSLHRATGDWTEALVSRSTGELCCSIRNAANRARSMSCAAMLTIPITTSGISVGP